jgi:serine protease inhibitor
MKIVRRFWKLALCLFAFGAPEALKAADATPAAQAVNALGIDLLKGTKPGASALLSPYSIQSALAMTYAGADGATRAEMAKVLHYTGDEAALHQAFAALQQSLKPQAIKNRDGSLQELAQLSVANRLFGQTGYEFRAPFLSLTKDTYGAPLQLLDYQRDPSAATREINTWVADQTSQRIRDLIPSGALTRDTRLVLVNAVYLKAPWVMPFTESGTRPQPFHLGGGKFAEVLTMSSATENFGYAQRDGFKAITLPYRGVDLQFLILLPDAVDGLAALESKLTPALLATNANPGRARLNLHLPKFKMEPPMMKLSDSLQSLGMKTAFDKPRRSANFDRMSPRKPDDYLCIAEVFHKTFLELDEKGTEAAAATAVAMMRATSIAVDEPITVKVDRPFLFAIQHRATGACLFFGRMTDPR